MGFLDFSCSKCGLSYKKLSEMLGNNTGLPSWTNKKRLTRTVYHLFRIDDGKITFLRGSGKETFPVSYSTFSVLHDAVCNREIDNTPAELERFMPTHCEVYLSSLFKHCQCGEDKQKIIK